MSINIDPRYLLLHFVSGHSFAYLTIFLTKNNKIYTTTKLVKVVQKHNAQYGTLLTHFIAVSSLSMLYSLVLNATKIWKFKMSLKQLYGRMVEDVAADKSKAYHEGNGGQVNIATSGGVRVYSSSIK